MSYRAYKEKKTDGINTVLLYRADSNNFYHLVSIWYIGEVVGMRVIVVKKIAVLESSVRAIAEVDSMMCIVYRYGMKEIVKLESDPGNMYRK